MKINIQVTIKIILVTIALFAASCALQKKIKTVEEPNTYMQEIYTSLVNDMSNEVEVAIVEDSVRIIFVSGILFKVNEAIINNELHPYFKRFTKVLNQYTNTTILITGHTDNTGDDKLNIDLSQKRADNTKKLLENFGLDGERIYTLGHGATLPIASNNTSTGRAINRRVEFIILYNYNSNNE